MSTKVITIYSVRKTGIQNELHQTLKSYRRNEFKLKLNSPILYSEFNCNMAFDSNVICNLNYIYVSNL